MGFEREAKHVQRKLRSISVDAIAPHIAFRERHGDGLWCQVGSELTFVRADGGETITDWDDPLEYAQFARYVAAHPERLHDTWESARAFVQSRLPRKD